MRTLGPTVPVLTPELGVHSTTQPAAPSSGVDFASELGGALEQVTRLQTDADSQAASLAAGGGNLHETALALEKADIGMRLMTRVRNKLVEAYQEIMRMSV